MRRERGLLRTAGCSRLACGGGAEGQPQGLPDNAIPLRGRPELPAGEPAGALGSHARSGTEAGLEAATKPRARVPDLGFPERGRRREQRGPPSHQMSAISRSRRGEEGRAALGASAFRWLSPASEGCNYKFLGARDREASSPDEVRTIVLPLVRLQQKLDLFKAHILLTTTLQGYQYLQSTEAEKRAHRKLNDLLQVTVLLPNSEVPTF